MLTKAEKVKRLRALLVRACNAHIKKGGEILDVGFKEDNACCPIRCAAGEPVVPYNEKLSEKLKFNFSNDDMWSFIAGFDGHEPDESRQDMFFKLGVELRKKYIKG